MYCISLTMNTCWKQTCMKSFFFCSEWNFLWVYLLYFHNVSDVVGIWLLECIHDCPVKLLPSTLTPHHPAESSHTAHGKCTTTLCLIIWKYFNHALQYMKWIIYTVQLNAFDRIELLILSSDIISCGNYFNLFT